MNIHKQDIYMAKGNITYETDKLSKKTDLFL